MVVGVGLVVGVGGVCFCVDDGVCDRDRECVCTCVCERVYIGVDDGVDGIHSLCHKHTHTYTHVRTQIQGEVRELIDRLKKVNAKLVKLSC